MVQKLSLDALAREQAERAAAGSPGRSATTVYGGHEHVLRQTLMAIAGGELMDEHANPGEATLYVMRGRVRLKAGADSWEGRTGDLIVIPDAMHSVEAIEDSVILLTVAKVGETA
jgi:quercetin dioxygenase-like cupin family protein